MLTYYDNDKPEHKLIIGGFTKQVPDIVSKDKVFSTKKGNPLAIFYFDYGEGNISGNFFGEVLGYANNHQRSYILTGSNFGHGNNDILYLDTFRFTEEEIKEVISKLDSNIRVKHSDVLSFILKDYQNMSFDLPLNIAESKLKRLLTYNEDYGRFNIQNVDIIDNIVYEKPLRLNGYDRNGTRVSIDLSLEKLINLVSLGKIKIDLEILKQKYFKEEREFTTQSKSK